LDWVVSNGRETKQVAAYLLRKEVDKLIAESMLVEVDPVTKMHIHVQTRSEYHRAIITQTNVGRIGLWIIDPRSHEILCVKERYKQTLSELWQDPGGKPGDQEDFYETVKREAHEELHEVLSCQQFELISNAIDGLRRDAVEPHEVRYAGNEARCVFFAIYIRKYDLGNLDFTSDGKTTDVRWFNANDPVLVGRETGRPHMKNAMMKFRELYGKNITILAKQPELNKEAAPFVPADAKALAKPASVAHPLELQTMLVQPKGSISSCLSPLDNIDRAQMWRMTCLSEIGVFIGERTDKIPYVTGDDLTVKLKHGHMIMSDKDKDVGVCIGIPLSYPGMYANNPRNMMFALQERVFAERPAPRDDHYKCLGMLKRIVDVCWSVWCDRDDVIEQMPYFLGDGISTFWAGKIKRFSDVYADPDTFLEDVKKASIFVKREVGALHKFDEEDVAVPPLVEAMKVTFFDGCLGEGEVGSESFSLPEAAPVSFSPLLESDSAEGEPTPAKAYPIDRRVKDKYQPRMITNVGDHRQVAAHPLLNVLFNLFFAATYCFNIKHTDKREKMAYIAEIMARIVKGGGELIEIDGHRWDAHIGPELRNAVENYLQDLFFEYIVELWVDIILGFLQAEWKHHSSSTQFSDQDINGLRVLIKVFIKWLSRQSGGPQTGPWNGLESWVCGIFVALGGLEAPEGWEVQLKAWLINVKNISKYIWANREEMTAEEMAEYVLSHLIDFPVWVSPNLIVPQQWVPFLEGDDRDEAYSKKAPSCEWIEYRWGLANINAAVKCLTPHKYSLSTFVGYSFGFRPKREDDEGVGLWRFSHYGPTADRNLKSASFSGSSTLISALKAGRTHEAALITVLTCVSRLMQNVCDESYSTLSHGNPILCRYLLGIGQKWIGEVRDYECLPANDGIVHTLQMKLQVRVECGIWDDAIECCMSSVRSNILRVDDYSDWLAAHNIPTMTGDLAWHQPCFHSVGGTQSLLAMDFNQHLSMWVPPSWMGYFPLVAPPYYAPSLLFQSRPPDKGLQFTAPPKPKMVASTGSEQAGSAVRQAENATGKSGTSVKGSTTAGSVKGQGRGGKASCARLDVAATAVSASCGATGSSVACPKADGRSVGPPPGLNSKGSGKRGGRGR
jgi:8-oxo-dGTP pyrophosphatase MutT (NUDIX family)